MIENGFRRGVIDQTLFIKEKGADIMLVQVYVDDIIFGSTDQKMVDEFEDVMQKRFKMSSLGAINFFLGLQVDQTEKGIFLHQSKYVADILSRFKMENERVSKNPLSVIHGITPENTRAKVSPTLYKAIIGSLMYLTASRPDTMFATCLCAHYQAQPNVNHMLAAKKIMRYLKGTPSLGLWYPRKDGFGLTTYSDSDYGGCKIDFKSTSGGCQFLGSRLVSWQCKKQTAVAQSTCEVEYIVATICTSQVVWIQQQLWDYVLHISNTPIYVDNTATIAVTKNPVNHSKTKHIGIKYHFIRDCYEKRLIDVLQIGTQTQRADLFTKAFDRPRFLFLLNVLGVRERAEVVSDKELLK
ncbi:uncharacterized mitochondrial protein AtMg00810-like [Rutidosis leptorrhynchoides]|uniref:uncharacterized mitochondrial protein AtMg00810-like n=1 Tax=Rutidosis leptorrhynchoides TaxID=125765 RepID=UPI003A98DEB5